MQCVKNISSKRSKIAMLTPVVAATIEKVQTAKVSTSSVHKSKRKRNTDVSRDDVITTEPPVSCLTATDDGSDVNKANATTKGVMQDETAESLTACSQPLHPQHVATVDVSSLWAALRSGSTSSTTIAPVNVTQKRKHAQNNDELRLRCEQQQSQSLSPTPRPSGPKHSRKESTVPLSDSSHRPAVEPRTLKPKVNFNSMPTVEHSSEIQVRAHCQNWSSATFTWRFVAGGRRACFQVLAALRSHQSTGAQRVCQGEVPTG